MVPRYDTLASRAVARSLGEPVSQLGALLQQETFTKSNLGACWTNWTRGRYSGFKPSTPEVEKKATEMRSR